MQTDPTQPSYRGFIHQYATVKARPPAQQRRRNREGLPCVREAGERNDRGAVRVILCHRVERYILVGGEFVSHIQLEPAINNALNALGHLQILAERGHLRYRGNHRWVVLVEH
jgi:hypothetical protein